MAQQKFFSGLTEGMINRASGERPDRQKTHFYWPEEYGPGDEMASPVNHKPPSEPKVRTPPGTPPAINAPRDTRPPRRTAESHIRFYDGVESSFGELERSRAHERHAIEQFLRQQSEEDTGEAARAKRHSTLQSKIEFYDYCTPPPPPAANNGYGGRPTGHTPRTTGSNGFHHAPEPEPEPDLDELDFDDRCSVRSSACSSTYTASTSTTTTPTTDGWPDVPEHKRNSQRHLRSSINFHGGCTTTADDSDAARKPTTVRESATSRVGVGLPNL